MRWKSKKQAHRWTPSSSHSIGGRRSEGCRCRSAGSRNRSVKGKTDSFRRGDFKGKKANTQSKTFPTNLIEGLVRADDHLRLVGVNSHKVLSLWDSGMLHGSGTHRWESIFFRLQIWISMFHVIINQQGIFKFTWKPGPSGCCQHQHRVVARTRSLWSTWDTVNRDYTRLKPHRHFKNKWFIYRHVTRAQRWMAAQWHTAYIHTHRPFTQRKARTHRKVRSPVHNFRAGVGIPVHHLQLDNQRIPFLPVLRVQLGERGTQG